MTSINYATWELWTKPGEITVRGEPVQVDIFQPTARVAAARPFTFVDGCMSCPAHIYLEIAEEELNVECEWRERKEGTQFEYPK